MYPSKEMAISVASFFILGLCVIKIGAITETGEIIQVHEGKYGKRRLTRVKVEVLQRGTVWFEELTLANRLQANGEYFGAMKKYEMLTRLYDLREEEGMTIYINLGRVCALLGFVEKAQSAFETAIAHNVASPRGHFSLGWLATIRGNFHKAVEHFKTCLFHDEDHSISLRYLGQLFFIQVS